MERTPDSRLQRLREGRATRNRSTALSELISVESRTLKRQHRRTGGASAAWDTVCPPELADRTIVGGLVRGVLTIKVECASTRFEVDRFLRSGGFDALVQEAPASIQRVKVVLGSVRKDRTT